MSRAPHAQNSEALRVALRSAVDGRPNELEQLLARRGGLPGRPNLKLAAAFGAELASLPGPVERLLERFTHEAAAAADPRSFLPVAAAHGWMQRLRAGHDSERAWSALRLLAADPRLPVRLGTRQALQEGALRDAGADLLIARATSWLEDDHDREQALGAAAVVIDTLSDPQLQSAVRDHEAMFDYLARVIERVANAPRSAARSQGRRRILATLPLTLARVVAFVRTRERGFEWFREQCTQASQPDVRAAFSQALLELADDARSPGGAALAELRKTLEASAKPIRDAARVRPGHGRGRRSRAVR